MTSRLRKLLVLVPLLLLVFVNEGPASVAPSPALPNPVLYLLGTETFTTGGKTFRRYKYDVFNKDAYPADFFAAAPQLPPCGTNRTPRGRGSISLTRMENGWPACVLYPSPPI